MKTNEILDQLNEENIDSMFVYSPENIKYISDFYPSSFAYLIIDDEPILYVNSIDKESAEEKSQIETRDIVKFAEVKELLNGTIAVENSLDFGLTKYLSDDISSVKTSEVFYDKRKTKTKEEITKIKNSIGIAENAIGEIDFTSTEKFAAASLEFDMTINGSIKPAFDTIVASGKRSSSPHSETSMNRVETPIVVDWGAKYDYYCSDITRTFIDTERQQEIWDIVLEAQKAAISTIAPGVAVADVDNAARDVISEYGYGEYFIHSTGHGFGLEIHEDPVISNKVDTVLEENMVITAEPGIYIPGEFGVRIEDDVLVKKNSEVLTSLDKKLDFML
ncbi:aminopeptidase P family protein [Methanosphaera sp. ISO3-F5]|uniref:M24 family metallopeptidase n=1 Tax=Methanosphaera sp. ISO3-F5 TaxID=1452353 RepID=UPI002B262041|nr:aminopeptidase P family protein [Methanosphaera sp. ISO3-F5]WQH64572.1 aminopeptidase P family protein [Methanosphaera sp. ISO3-F5]